MIYRIASGNWSTFTDEEAVTPLNFVGPAMIVIDPGKTNLAMFIASTYGSVLSYVECSGKDCDTTDYCADLRRFIQRYCEKLDIRYAGVEQAVAYEGMKYYRSQMVLTEVRANILAFFHDIYGIKAIEINNYSWKSAVLPQGYRGHSEKGSLRYFNERGQFLGVTHDVTDCFCMYLYMQERLGLKDELYCLNADVTSVGYELLIAKVGQFNVEKKFKYNRSFTVSQNIAYYLNRISYKEFSLTVPVECLSLEEIYGSTIIVDTNSIDTVEVVVARTS